MICVGGALGSLLESLTDEGKEEEAEILDVGRIDDGPGRVAEGVEAIRLATTKEPSTPPADI